jgi:hypothetical protein
MALTPKLRRGHAEGVDVALEHLVGPTLHRVGARRWLVVEEAGALTDATSGGCLRKREAREYAKSIITNVEPGRMGETNAMAPMNQL